MPPVDHSWQRCASKPSSSKISSAIQNVIRIIATNKISRHELFFMKKIHDCLFFCAENNKIYFYEGIVKNQFV